MSPAGSQQPSFLPFPSLSQPFTGGCSRALPLRDAALVIDSDKTCIVFLTAVGVSRGGVQHYKTLLGCPVGSFVRSFVSK